MNRRTFVQALLSALPVATLFSLRANAQAPANPKAPPAAGEAPADIPVVKESDPMPKSLNYCENADKGKSKICPTRKEPARAKQYCDNCQFYTSAGKKGRDMVGRCQILQNHLVKAKGWCNSYVQKV